MSLSLEFIALTRRLRECSRELLPATNPTSHYGNGEILRMLAFRLFAHAEIEGFLESLADKLVTEIAKRHTSSGLPPQLARHLILHMTMVEKYPPRELTPLPSPKTTKQIAGFLTNHADVIAGNNGVTEKDVLKMFVPLGFELSSFDRGWLRSMTALGQARGEVAHGSAILAVGASVQPAPSSERTMLVTPLWGLRRLTHQTDQILSTL